MFTHTWNSQLLWLFLSFTSCEIKRGSSQTSRVRTLPGALGRGDCPCDCGPSHLIASGGHASRGQCHCDLHTSGTLGHLRTETASAAQQVQRRTPDFFLRASSPLLGCFAESGHIGLTWQRGRCRMSNPQRSICVLAWAAACDDSSSDNGCLGSSRF